MCCLPQGATNTVPADEIRESPTGRAHKASMVSRSFHVVMPKELLLQMFLDEFAVNVA